MKRLVVTLAMVVWALTPLLADEGMWLLPYLQRVNYKDMKAKGLRLSAQQIYNPDGASLKDAIIIFGNGCTGEIVSPDGLIFTNHHCGYSSIQSLSSVEHDYLKNGFWAMNRNEELPVPGLTIQFIRSVEEVTDRILGNVPDIASQQERTQMVNENIQALQTQLQEQNPGKAIVIRDFYGGNRYFAFVHEIYSDIRLVGAPPTSIGKFGGDTDNWMWPRHTCDFSVFRVYASPDGSPAAYSKDNVPYHAKSYLKISLKGYDEGDFAMIMGFPGTTHRFMTSREIDRTLDTDNPNRIYVRGQRQDILRKQMAASDRVRIQYASKFASSSNYWKNSIGMSRALVKLKIKDKKLSEEALFTQWAEADPMREQYSRALPLIFEAVDSLEPLAGQAQILSETVFRSIEIAVAAARANRIMAGKEPTPERIALLKRSMAAFYKDYDAATDRQVTGRMIEIIKEKMCPEYMPQFVTDDVNARFGSDTQAYVDWLYSNSIFADQSSFDRFMANFDKDLLDADPAMKIYRSTVKQTSNLAAIVAPFIEKFNEGHRLYIAGLMAMNPDRQLYPDANFTIRLTYGNVKSYSPADGVEYQPYTTLKGVMQKEDPANPTEFTVPEELKKLYSDNNYGQYSQKSSKKSNSAEALHVAFLTTNDITGGNSGSPVLNANGELIGLAFDGNWEAMSGDIVFEPELQRCINVDIRYVLFIIDKFAGAGYLLDEMTIVR